MRTARTTIPATARAISRLLLCAAMLGCTPSRAGYLDRDGSLTPAEAAECRHTAETATDPAAALAAWRRLIRGGEQDAATLLAASRAASGWALALEADADGRADIAREAVAWAEHVRDAQPGSAPAAYARALALGLLAESASLEVAPKDVLHAALEVVALDPRLEHAAGHRMAGLFYLRAPDLYGGDLDLALEHLATAVELAPDYAENHVALAEARLEDDDRSGAAAALDTADGLAPDGRVAAWITRLRERTE